MNSRKEIVIDVMFRTGFIVSVWAFAVWCAWFLAKGAI